MNDPQAIIEQLLERVTALEQTIAKLQEERRKLSGRFGFRLSFDLRSDMVDYLAARLPLHGYPSPSTRRRTPKQDIQPSD
jgi:hypothetical protein